MLTQRLGEISDNYVDNLLSMIKDNPASCDEVWFASIYGYPKIDTHKECAEKTARQADKFREAGVRVSMQISNTIGHGEYIKSHDCSGLVYENSPVKNLVAADGTVARYSFCWRGKVFRDYIAEMIKAYLVIKPEYIWFDDDFRPNHHTPVEFGCFCDDCIKEFNKEYGSNFTREELVKELNYGDLKCRKAFIEFTKKGLADFMTECCGVIHKELPNTKIGLQQGTMGGFIGDSGNKYLYEAIHKATGLPVSVRPGGGTYTDQDMREFIKKANEIERQIRDCPDCVTDIRPEIESLPYVAYGKSLSATCFETTLYFAVGANSMSYAMMMDVNEDFSWYRKEFEAFSKHREYWEKLSKTNKISAQCGVNAVYPDGRWAIKCEKPFDYAESDRAEENILRYVSLPMSYLRNTGGTHIIHGNDAARISDETICDLLSKPVITDAKTIEVLTERGYKFDISAEPIDTIALHEDYAKHKINDGITDKSWTGSFAGKRQGYKLNILSENVEIVGLYGANNTGVENDGAVATAVITTQNGAKWAVFGFDLWNRIISTSRRNQIFNTVEYISGKPLPARLIEAFSSIILPRVYKNGALASVSVVNCMPGKSGEYHIKLQAKEGAKALYMAQYGKKTELTVGKDGILTMPSLGAWNVATVFFEE